MTLLPDVVIGGGPICDGRQLLPADTYLGIVGGRIIEIGPWTTCERPSDIELITSILPVVCCIPVSPMHTITRSAPEWIATPAI